MNCATNSSVTIDPDLPLKCPRCGERLTYVTTRADETHIYVCSVHSEYQLSPSGYLRGGVGPYGRAAKFGRPQD